MDGNINCTEMFPMQRNRGSAIYTLPQICALDYQPSAPVKTGSEDDTGASDEETGASDEEAGAEDEGLGFSGLGAVLDEAGAEDEGAEDAGAVLEEFPPQDARTIMAIAMITASFLFIDTQSSQIFLYLSQAINL